MSDQRIPISQLSETQTAPDASYIAIDDGSLTKKITVENFNSTSTASAQQYATQAAASAQTVEDNIATSAAQIREATLAAREATQASTAASASATSAYDSASLAQNYSANASTSAGQAMNAADSAAQNLTASKRYAEDSEAWAVGKRNGSDVPASDETYQNNAKYYANSASGSATRAETAAQSINAPDTTLTVSGVAADSKATGDRISSVNTELVDIRVQADGSTASTAGDAVRAQVAELKNDLSRNENAVEKAIIYDGVYPLSFSWEMGSINANYEEVNNTNPSQARTVGYYTPQGSAVLHINLINISSVICVAYDLNGTGLSRTVYRSSDTQIVDYQLEYGKKYRFALYIGGVNIDRDNIQTYVTFLLDILLGKIGIPQLDPEIAALYTKLTDVFATTDYYYKFNAGVTKTKTENTISWETTDALTAYVTYNYQMLEGHQYAIYYDLTGTSPNTNYGFTMRLAVDGYVTGVLASLSQTSGADSSGTFLFTVPAGGSGYPVFNMPNNVGQTISGDIYIYDITGLTTSQSNGIDFSQVGASKVFVFATGTSSGSISDWSSKKVVFYGDSITQQNYPEKVQTALGFTLVKNAIGGSRFAQIASDPTINANSLSSDTRIATLPSDADVVCIMGGTNDFRYTPIEQTLEYDNGFGVLTLKAAVAHTIYGVQTQCPNAKIYLLTLIGGRGDADPTVLQPLPLVADSGSGQGKSSLDIRNAMIEVAEYLNIPVIDTWSCGINGLNRNTTIKDTVHPTEKGNVMIAEYITAALINSAPW